MLTTYGELKFAIADWLERKDLAAFIPQFILMAERQLYRRLRVAETVQVNTYEYASFPLNTSEISLPADYAETKTLLHGGRVLKRIADTEYLRYINDMPARGEPRYFARVGDKLKFYPEADSENTVTLIYWRDLTDTTQANGTTGIQFQQWPDLLLYGALLQAEAFLIGDERVPLWKTLYETQLEVINMEADMEEVSGGPTTTSSIYYDGVA